jgi:hypothetical protein
VGIEYSFELAKLVLGEGLDLLTVSVKSKLINQYEAKSLLSREDERD